MVRFSAITLFLLLSMVAEVRSGDQAQPTPRREFKQSKTYPYVFVPVGYLSTGAPPPLLFGPPASDCENRTPPAPPKAPKKAEEKPVTPTPTPPPASPFTPPPAPLPPPPVPETVPPLPGSETPAYPPPATQALPQEESLDLNKYPSEVIDIFKNPYNVPKSRQHFFDPVFEPPQTRSSGQQTQTGVAPAASKATLREQ